jgi:hypothetical protein
VKKLLAIALCVSLAACATRSHDIAATYVSPLAYQNLTCEQLYAAAERISSRAAQAAGVQDSNASRDALAMGAGLILFWPALFFIGGDGGNAAEIARLKGEIDAIEVASRDKGCNIQFQQR